MDMGTTRNLYIFSLGRCALLDLGSRSAGRVPAALVGLCEPPDAFSTEGKRESYYVHGESQYPPLIRRKIGACPLCRTRFSYLPHFRSPLHRAPLEPPAGACDPRLCIDGLAPCSVHRMHSDSHSSSSPTKLKNAVNIMAVTTVNDTKFQRLLRLRG